MKSDEAFPQNHAFQECQTCYNDTITGTNTCTTSSCANGCPGIPATQCKGGGNCCTCIGAVSSFGALSRRIFFPRSSHSRTRVLLVFPIAHRSHSSSSHAISKRTRETNKKKQGGEPPNCQRSNFPFPPPPPLPPPNPPPLPPPA